MVSNWSRLPSVGLCWSVSMSFNCWVRCFDRQVVVGNLQSRHEVDNYDVFVTECHDALADMSVMSGPSSLQSEWRLPFGVSDRPHHRRPIARGDFTSRSTRYARSCPHNPSRTTVSML